MKNVPTQQTSGNSVDAEHARDGLQNSLKTVGHPCTITATHGDEVKTSIWNLGQTLQLHLVSWSTTIPIPACWSCNRVDLNPIVATAHGQRQRLQRLLVFRSILVLGAKSCVVGCVLFALLWLDNHLPILLVFGRWNVRLNDLHQVPLWCITGCE